MSKSVRSTPHRRIAAWCAALAVAFSPVVGLSGAVAAPAHERTTPAADFTAQVRSIEHATGRVEMTGTGPTGGSVAIAVDGADTVWTEVRDGVWSAGLRVGPGPRVLHVTSQVTGETVDLPVEVLGLLPPTWVPTIDPFTRTITLEGSGVSRPARYVVTDDGEPVADVVAEAGAPWRAVLRDRAPGRHDIVVERVFDGTVNGIGRDSYELSGAAEVGTASASRETRRTTLAGRAPVGTTLRFADASGPVLGADGEPVVATTSTDTTWRAQLPFPETIRFHRITVTTFDDGTPIGTTNALVTVPIAITGSVEELADGSVRLSGTGEPGGVVALETASGTPVDGADGRPITAAIGRGWELVVPRATLPGDVVVARQRVQGVEQGALRLLLPKLPVRPAPEHGPGPGAGPGVSTGNHRAAPQATAGRITAVPSGRLAYTGEDPSVPLGVAGVLLAAGLGGLAGARALGRRGAHRG